MSLSFLLSHNGRFIWKKYLFYNLIFSRYRHYYVLDIIPPYFTDGTECLKGNKGMKIYYILRETVIILRYTQNMYTYIHMFDANNNISNISTKQRGVSEETKKKASYI